MDRIHFIDDPDNSNQNNCFIEIMSGKFKEYDEDQILTCVTQLEDRWCLNRQGDRMIPLVSPFKQFYMDEQLDNSGLPIDLDIECVSEKHRRQSHMLCDIYHRAKQLELFDRDTEDINGNEFKIEGRINRLIDMLDDAYECVFRYARQFERINHPTMVPITPDSDHTRFRNTTLDMEDITPYQNLLLALLKATYELNYRRYKDHCCEQIKTADGHLTRAWKAVMPISNFVYSRAQKETNGAMWKDLTHKASHARDASRHLSECVDMQFPEITKNRHVWSFNNGIFVGKEKIPKTGMYESRFYPYDSKDYRCLDATLVSSKFFDQNFVDYSHIEDWYEIPTPVFQSIMDYQKFDDDVCRWMYVMGGKLCFDVGDLDGWQVIPFLKGVAMSGKSTIITKVFKKFYDADDVRTLSNNVERKFGLSSIYDGFMFIAPEVKSDMCLEQAEFQSLVSGEDISLARKYEKAKSVEWTAPGILAGNEVPNWKDNSGSVLRRILSWNFNKKVMNADPTLDDKLNAEIPTILLKCVRAYLEYSQKYSEQDIWNVVPEYFKSVQTQVAMITNSLQNFLASEKIKIEKTLYCPQKIFVQVFNQHCQENNLGRFKFNPDFYMGPFSTREIEVRTESKTYNGRVYPAQPFIFGLDVVQETLVDFGNGGGGGDY
jgi:hypothetical protein